MRRFPSIISARRPWLTATGLAALLATSALHAETWVVTDQTHPVSGKADRLILLDAPSRIEAELASDLPADPSRAERIARDRLSQGGANLQRRIASAYQGVTDAWSLGITSLPAVVVDQRYVVYGEPDVARAIARIEQHRRTQP
ncbi:MULTISPECIES: TIGR03757 family integrating conjugative element protein [Gammaproteobacteria]|uniref:TIGR03757 family integrating conjugative element protein n=1 Tax=Gammaproteobacteria TaxID=1236 RepID=UPI00178584F9|nr:MULTISPECIES: TIGR03757 family integrating conjugative element protein [Gammaproteobacteria]MBD9368000.1 TIGR03757 family integrating conjugative element protein [Xanthomonas sp. XNM01]MBH3343795.1 TIGR03757 family integrating conjugative element protein [Pseudomonas parafulva]